MLLVSLLVTDSIRLGKTSRLQVVAWKGWQEHQLYAPAVKGARFSIYDLDFLLYVRGFPALPQLYTKEGQSYDVLISNVEFLEYYRVAGHIWDLNKRTQSKVLNWWANIAPIVKKTLGSASGDAAFWKGVPLRFGFHEILVTGSLYEMLISRSGRRHLSYSDFKLENILEMMPGKKIAIWNYYLPALHHLVNIYGYSKAFEDTSKVSALDVKRFLAELQEKIRPLKDRIIFLNEIDHIAGQLNSDEFAWLSGRELGASLVPLPVSIKAVVPQEDLFIGADVQLFWLTRMLNRPSRRAFRVN